MAMTRQRAASASVLTIRVQIRRQIMTILSTRPTAAAQSWLVDFAAALARNDVDAAIALFEPECYWRDLVAFTWNIRTQEGPDASGRCSGAARRHQADRVRHRRRSVRGGRRGRDLVHVRTGVGRRSAEPAFANGKDWTLTHNASPSSRGFEEHSGDRRVKGTKHGVHPLRQTWLEQRQQEPRAGYTEQPYVVIIGGGQGGIALGARLRRLACPPASSAMQTRTSCAQAPNGFVVCNDGVVRKPAQGARRARCRPCPPPMMTTYTGCLV